MMSWDLALIGGVGVESVGSRAAWQGKTLIRWKCVRSLSAVGTTRNWQVVGSRHGIVSGLSLLARTRARSHSMTSRPGYWETRPR